MAFIPQFIKSDARVPKRVLTYLIVSIITVCSGYAQQNIRVQGTIISIPGTNPIPYVDIIHDGGAIGHSDIDGKFAISVPRDAELEFHSKQHNTIKISVDGRQVIEVTMTERLLEIEEAVVVAEGPSNKIVISPSEIEVKGNYFYLKTKFRIPATLFKTDYRFIIQPTIYDVTKNERHYLLPVVIDGKKYSIVQHRYLNYDKSNDKLNTYIVDNEITKDNDIYSYADSMYFDLKDLNNEFRSDCYLTLVSYRPPNDYLDSLTIARGLCNVLRFLDSTFDPMDLDKMIVLQGSNATLDTSKIDPLLIPRPEMKLMSDKGLTEIVFGVGKSSINYDNPINKKNIGDIINVLENVQNDEYATLKSISIIGYASPEGNFKFNKGLSDKRTQSLLSIVTESLSPEILKYTSLQSKGAVQPWSKVVELIERDSLPIAQKLRKIITLTNNSYPESQRAIMRMPEYRQLIIPTYLPQLRKVEYVIEYSVFRDLTTEEIFERHSQKKELSRYEYFKLILAVTDDKQREELEDEAIKMFPNFARAVNRVAIRTILKGESNLKLQEPVLLGKNVPVSMVYNQVLMALREKNVSMADSLISTIGDDPEMRLPKALLSAINGNYQDAYPAIAEQGGFNEILLMLALKYNTQAYIKMGIYLQDEKNSKDAKSWYVYALCANRLDDLSSAMAYMGMALKMDPSLGKIAALDSDVMDIYELVIADVEAELKAEAEAKAAAEAKAKAAAETKVEADE